MAGPFDVLLDVQAHDTKLDQLRHLSENLPARIERNAARQALDALDGQLAVTQAQRDELARQQKRLDDEIATIGDKRTQVNTALYSGSVTNARELQDLTEEIEALSRRITSLEDDDLEIMEKLEPVDASVSTLIADRASATANLEAAELRLTAAEAELAVDLETEMAARTAVAADVPAELLSEYESLRGGRGGIGVARLIGTQCGGCHLTLSAMEAARIRKSAAEVTHCEECGRLLVP